jgi:folate-binding protein YgfZ
MYILRADVQLHNRITELCLLGLQADFEPDHNDLPNSALQTLALAEGGLVFKYPDGNHWLWLGNDLQAINYWKQMTKQQRVVGQTPQSGLLHDINAGIAWITTETSEQFIPQSINLDQLGGISFNKGCYTGQEIVARTHYLGKSKNTMVRAHMPLGTDVIPGAKLYNLDSDSKQSIGNIVNAIDQTDQCEMLAVIKEELVRAQNLSLENAPSPIIII